MPPDSYYDLTGKLLVAMPTMPDPRFAHSVILMCVHSEEGAMGIIVNKFLGFMKLSEVLDSSDIPNLDETYKLPAHFGGPVERSRGFVVHSADYQSEGATMNVTDQLSMTATLDVLEKIHTGAGPDFALLALGYSSWGPGQLEDEIKANGWLVTDPDCDLIFVEEDDGKWAGALKKMGVDPLTLSGTAGRA